MNDIVKFLQPRAHVALPALSNFLSENANLGPHDISLLQKVPKMFVQASSLADLAGNVIFIGGVFPTYFPEIVITLRGMLYTLEYYSEVQAAGASTWFVALKVVQPGFSRAAKLYMTRVQSLQKLIADGKVFVLNNSVVEPAGTELFLNVLRDLTPITTETFKDLLMVLDLNSFKSDKFYLLVVNDDGALYSVLLQCIGHTAPTSSGLFYYLFRNYANGVIYKFHPSMTQDGILEQSRFYEVHPEEGQLPSFFRASSGGGAGGATGGRKRRKTSRKSASKRRTQKRRKSKSASRKRKQSKSRK
jgi:hypothetical protein